MTLLEEARAALNLGPNVPDQLVLTISELDNLTANVREAQDPKSDPYMRIGIEDIDAEVLVRSLEFIYGYADLQD